MSVRKSVRRHSSSSRFGSSSVAAAVPAARRCSMAHAGSPADAARSTARDVQRTSNPVVVESSVGRHPTEPSIWSWISRFISTAYSIGSSFTIGSMKPDTIIAAASSFGMPRLVR